MFQADPMRKPDVDGCATCHVNPNGGGARNEFGMAYERANDTITPLLRASHPQNFTFESATLPDGSKFYFSDPASKFAIYEKNGNRVVVDIGAMATPAAARVPPAANRMTFFVTSTGIATGGKMGGLAGADKMCQDLAKAAGADDRTWRAYLSTTLPGPAGGQRRRPHRRRPVVRRQGRHRRPRPGGPAPEGPREARGAADREGRAGGDRRRVQRPRVHRHQRRRHRRGGQDLRQLDGRRGRGRGRRPGVVVERGGAGGLWADGRGIGAAPVLFRGQVSREEIR